MKAKVYGIRISIGLIVPAIIMIAITTITKSECPIFSLLNDVGIGVLGSSIVVLLISVREYSVEKKRNLIDYCILAEEAVKQFRSIKYFHFSEETDLLLAFYEEQSKNELWKDFGRPEETVEKEKLISYYKSASHFLDNSSDKQCDLILDTRLKIKIEELEKSMESYIKASNYSIKTLINCYSTLRCTPLARTGRAAHFARTARAQGNDALQRAIKNAKRFKPSFCPLRIERRFFTLTVLTKSKLRKSDVSFGLALTKRSTASSENRDPVTG